MRSVKFLVDADMPRSSVGIIRSFGFDGEDVRDIGMRTARDKEIIEYALKNNRIIVTRDTDFGEVLLYPKHPGAIIFRLPHTFTVKEINGRLKDFLNSANEEEMRNALLIVELGRYRRRPL